ncbi:MAG: penicillin-binding protein 2, partial [Flavobacteriaceae bacterium]
MNKKLILPGFTVAVLLLFTVRLVQLQIVSTVYDKLSMGNAVVTRTLYPERGFMYDRNGHLLVANQPSYDLMAIPEQIEAFDTLELTSLLEISKGQLMTKLREIKKYSTKLPSVIIGQINKQQHAYIQEKIWKYPGFFLQPKSQRAYFTEAAANLFGYVSEVNQNDLQKDDYYAMGELIGRQ